MLVVKCRNGCLLLTPGASHGIMIGHVVPEATRGGPLALVADGDMITYDLKARKLDLHVDSEELERRRAVWTPPPPRCNPRSWLGRYAKQVSDASHGAVLQ